jgi:glycosyltransferase involved in cell wall biosynthesis
MTVLDAPFLNPAPLVRVLGVRRGLHVARSVNGRILHQVLRQLRPDFVILASDCFYVPPTRSTVFFDFTDWVEESDRESFRCLAAYVDRTKDRVRGFLAPSEPLAERVADRFGIQVNVVENGANVWALRSASKESASQLRLDLGLTDRFVVGCIGNHGAFAGIDFTLEVFTALLKRMPDAALLIVGPVSYWRPLLDHFLSDRIVLTGPIEPEHIAPYFHSVDVGMIPFSMSTGTDYVLPLKLVGFTACRKFVISTPLAGITRLQWPNVITAERNVEDWVTAVETARSRHWQAEWDPIAEPFDWGARAKAMGDILLGVDCQG